MWCSGLVVPVIINVTLFAPSLFFLQPLLSNCTCIPDGKKAMLKAGRCGIPCDMKYAFYVLSTIMFLGLLLKFTPSTALVLRQVVVLQPSGIYVSLKNSNIIHFNSWITQVDVRMWNCCKNRLSLLHAVGFDPVLSHEDGIQHVVQYEFSDCIILSDSLENISRQIGVASLVVNHNSCASYIMMIYLL